jgi:glycosyltransferase involved in cell wall biosynthesis
VSEFQELEIRKLAPNSRAKFIVSPIPIDYSKIPSPGEFNELYDVALIGRLQVERGINEAVSVIKQLVKLRPSVKIAIVGDGPEVEFVKEELQVEVSAGNVFLTGPLFGGAIRRIFAQSKVLLSAAPSEGYGLTLREAQLSGMTIVARDSEGARRSSISLHSSHHFYTTENEAVTEIDRALNANKRLVENSELISHQRELDERGLRKLIESWVRPNA